MSIRALFRGSLFTNDFLCESIRDLDDWSKLDDAHLDALGNFIRDTLSNFPVASSPNETQTEDDLIWPILAQLGWNSYLRQQNLSAHGRHDIPDGLLFADNASKNQANRFSEELTRYEFGIALVESKRWLRPLDRRSVRRGEATAPSTQMLRYLRRVDDLTEGKVRWGILTNGAQWRLYFSGARSVSEQFFEIDLAVLFGIPPHGDNSSSLSNAERQHWLKVFALVFQRKSFVTGPGDPLTFHERSIAAGRFYENRVAADLSNLIFEQVFPDLARAIAANTPESSLEDVREATLIFLYRLLFILYAEDRDLLPVRDRRYGDYALREKVRDDVRRRKELGDIFSTTAARYWTTIDDLCRIINQGDVSIGIPPYNGGLFDLPRTPILQEVRLSDAVVAEVVDLLSYERTDAGRHYINYRDLGVQQLGSIYERLLEHEVIRDGGEIIVQPNISVRKESGSYYTPDDLVSLIVRETMGPLIQSHITAFTTKTDELMSSRLSEERKIGQLRQVDPAMKLLGLKICDPAMGSGHFLVNFVDYLTDWIATAMAEAENAWEGYVSPLTGRIEDIRDTIMNNAEKHGWTIDEEHLDDRHVIRRMVLKRCIYGVDKSPMVVELAKVALWLHTFTIGAPLSFLNHHLRCGDSLFGSWIHSGIRKAEKRGGSLFLDEPVKKAIGAAAAMQSIENLPDAEIAEAQLSAEIFSGVEEMTTPLDAFLSVVCAFEWINPKERKDVVALHKYFEGSFGNPIDIASGKVEFTAKDAEAKCFKTLLEKAKKLIDEEHFLNWQVAYPGVWSEWEKPELSGGFDAIIGNPPWDKIKLQQVEWFSARRPEIAMEPRAAIRKSMVADLYKSQDPLIKDFDCACERAKATARMARNCGDYPLLSKGDINLYSLFVERAMTLIKPVGMIGLVVPSGIASDKTSAKFFQSIATGGQLKTFFDFENKKVFFPDVHASFKFCTFIASLAKIGKPTKYASYIHNLSELNNPDRCFPLTAKDFARVNPNTGTVPIFRTCRDAELATAIYKRLPVLVNRLSGKIRRVYPIKFSTMFHMTNDSHSFRTRKELEVEEKAYPIKENRYRSLSGDWLPLYEGKMVQAFDHRAASIVIQPKNKYRPAQRESATPEQHKDPNWFPNPRYWVLDGKIALQSPYWLAYKDITAPTNARSMIAALIPNVGAGNTLPVITAEKEDVAFLLANFNAILFDYIARQKIQGQHLNWYIVEQIPVVPPASFDATIFGSKTAAEIVRETVLELTYTSHDMAPFAYDIGYTDESGNVNQPFQWDEERRLRLRSKLDALFFHLYGITNRDDIDYIYSTFPLVSKKEIDSYGCYLSRNLCIDWMNAFDAGDPDAEIRR